MLKIKIFLAVVSILLSKVVKRPNIVAILMLKKYTGFVENKYMHEHVVITHLYIVSHILYDRNFY